MTLPLAQFVQRAELEAEPRSGCACIGGADEYTRRQRDLNYLPGDRELKW